MQWFRYETTSLLTFDHVFESFYFHLTTQTGTGRYFMRVTALAVFSRDDEHPRIFPGAPGERLGRPAKEGRTSNRVKQRYISALRDTRVDRVWNTLRLIGPPQRFFLLAFSSFLFRRNFFFYVVRLPSFFRLFFSLFNQVFSSFEIEGPYLFLVPANTCTILASFQDFCGSVLRVVHPEFDRGHRLNQLSIL